MKFHDYLRKVTLTYCARPFALFVILLALTCCNRNKHYEDSIIVFPTSTEIEMFVNDRYYDPVGIFSIVVPEFYRTYITERPYYDELSCECVFGSKQRTAMSVYVVNYPPLGQLDQDAKVELLKGYFQDVKWPELTEDICAEAEIVFEEVLDVSSNPAFFVVAKLPEGSLHIGSSHRRPCDN